MLSANFVAVTKYIQFNVFILVRARNLTQTVKVRSHKIFVLLTVSFAIS